MGTIPHAGSPQGFTTLPRPDTPGALAPSSAPRSLTSTHRLAASG